MIGVALFVALGVAPYVAGLVRVDVSGADILAAARWLRRAVRP